MLNNPQGLICHKTHPNQTKPTWLSLVNDKNNSFEYLCIWIFQIYFSFCFVLKYLLYSFYAYFQNLLCFVNEGECPPLKLTLTGTCASTPTSREILTFQTSVRQKEVKSVPISNRTNQLWELRPIIDGNYWQGQHKFLVEPQSTKQYEITYKPMHMTGADGKKHVVSITFISLSLKIWLLSLILFSRHLLKDCQKQPLSLM